MAQKYLHSIKKYISKTMIQKELDVKDKEFDELVTIMGIYPYVPKEKQKVDRIQDFFYKITDYEKIKHSSVLKTLRRNKKRMLKKTKYLEQGLTLRASNIYEQEYEYVKLTKERFKTFGHALDELSGSLSNMCLAKKLNMNLSVLPVLQEFEEFVIAKNLLKHAFMSDIGIYYEVVINKIRIIWLNPYDGRNLDDAIEIRHDTAPRFKWSQYNCLHFASESEETESDEEEMEISTNLDVSLLSYGIQFYKYHTKLVLHKLNAMYLSEVQNTERLFSNKKFYIECKNLEEDLCFVIAALGGTVVRDDTFDISLGDVFDFVQENKLYVHPQFIFDCINARKFLNVDKYKIGKKLPPHISPFQINNFISEDVISSLSKRKKNKMQDIIDGFNDVHYREKKV